MRLTFVTTNKHKFEEVKQILAEFGVEGEWMDEDYNEPEGDVDFVARFGARTMAEKLNKPVCVDDTGVFFEAYPGFPGPHPKFVFEHIGFDGIMRLLEGKSRKAYFRTAVAYCEPGKEPVLFEGIMDCEVTKEVHNKEMDVQPYEKIFIPAGESRTLSDMTRTEKNLISHRGKAFRKLGEFLKEKYK